MKFRSLKISLLLSTFLLNAFNISTPTSASTFSEFTDIDNTHKYSEAIEFITQEKIVSGYEDRTFKPEKTINRAELTKIIIESFYTKEEIEQYENDNCFKDIQPNNWYTKYVCFAKGKNIIQGYSDNTFRPEQDINLVEALKITLKANNATSSQTTPWYKNYVDSASAKNIIPLDFTRFDQPIKRGQMAELITRTIKENKGSLENYLKESIDYKVTYETLQKNILVATSNFDPLNSNKEIIPAKNKIIPVPFTSQSPFGKWIPPFDEACEEASLLMIDYYFRGTYFTQETAKTEIVKLTSWVQIQGYAIDIGSNEMADTAKRYLSRNTKIYKENEVTIENIKKLITLGFPVIAPVAGQKIGNPYYTGAGPPYHVLVITGYDENNFIINDPGTQFGEKLSLPQDTFFDAIHDWAGSKTNVQDGAKTILVVN